MVQAPDQLREKRVELILQQLEDIPALPPPATAVIPIAAQNAAAVADAVTLVSSDSSFSQRILNLLAACGDEGLESIDRVVLRRGFETLRNAAIAIGVYNAFASSNREETSQFDSEGYWKHAVAVGCCAQL